jgi:hypothetical protein
MFLAILSTFQQRDGGSLQNNVKIGTPGSQQENSAFELAKSSLS